MAISDSEFLAHASEVAFELGIDHFRVSALTIRSREITFTETDGPAQPPIYAEREPPQPGREGRRKYDWQPAIAAPSWMNLAWLLEDLATWVQQMADDHITLVGLEAPEPAWCDLLVLDGDSAYRARIALACRREVLDFPGMYLRDLFAEGHYRAYLTPGLAEKLPVVDLRTVL
ncbi:hypothetical protein PV726_43375 [Streptomyces europaeiscabiei]|uniref:hypothetical protein n=1 Tax=Streptomyces europaeiscabiei TaxID=146819 RepID=UPI0029BE5F7B|nr:hypothetical protein [Streptomyces europaeiscabiei]MDX3696967.1 hypothetical protein [Streptomyces europaeiscabiei]